MPRTRPLRVLPTVPEPTLSAAIRDFLDWHEAKASSPRTRENYKEALDQLDAWLIETERSRNLSDIHRTDLQAFFIALQRRTNTSGQPISGSTVINRFRAIRAFFRWATTEAADNLIATTPTAGLVLPKTEERLPDVLTEAEMKAMLAAPQGTSFESRRDRAILGLLFETGVRLAELSNMKIEDLNREGRTILVHGKGRRVRTITYGAQTARLITKYLTARGHHEDADLPYLWLGRRGRLAQVGVIRATQRRALQARVDGWHVHRARHSWAHQLRLNGCSEGDLAVLGGWKPNSPMLYRYGASSATTRAIANFRSPLDRILANRE
jgi:site-specific recombinase XerD